MGKLCMALAGWLLLLLLAAPPAAAHKASVFGYLENGRIMGEGYFPGGGKAMGCKVVLLDASGKVLAATTTDGKGGFSLPAPQAKPPLKLVLNAGMGHKGEYTLTAKDLGQAGEKPQAVKPGEAARGSGEKTAPGPAAGGEGVNASMIQEAVEKALEQKLAPLTAQIAKMNAERQVGLSDIIGGIGYIIGLLGLAAYFKSKKR
ncbi:hypothetical protein AAU61_02930 [Desulfocarbo indianensis]|nr:hypothetical protein AAU61_02930 [Desulfocarbo indianensis]